MVDLNDYSYKLTTRHGKPVNNRVYRHSCNNCGADKGYLQKSHVKPDSWFQYLSTQDKDFKDSWSLNNLQPTWASLNRSKGARCATS